MIALFNPLLVACFTRPAKPEELAAIDAIAEEGLAEGIRGGMLFVIARKDMSGGIDPRVRATFESMIRKNAERSGASAVVILAAGFAGAIVRGFLAGLVQLTTRRQVVEVCGSIEHACRWLAPRHDLDAGALRLAIRRATAHLDLPVA